jgi:hypothetical protein
VAGGRSPAAEAHFVRPLLTFTHSAMKLASIISIIAATVGACKGSAPAPPRRAGEAVELARRFVRADTTSDGAAIDSLYAPKEGLPYCVYGFDAYKVITSVSVGDPHGRGDTIVVPLTYQVIGTVRSDDRHLVGLRYWHFDATSLVERDSLVAGPDSSGRLRFSCWLQVVPNHMTVGDMLANVVPHLDSASFVAWNAVNKQRPNPRLQRTGPGP